MKKSYIIPISCLLFSIVNVIAQKDEVILTIDDQKVYRSEFERIYRKNNSSVAYDQKTPEEYLDLFVNFKLKVIEAENLGYDTVPEYIQELSGYRDQLAKPYLEDRNVIDSLVREAYNRTIQEVKVSHILIKVSPNASAEDTLEAYNKIMEIRERILAGEPFEEVAKATSDDNKAKSNGGSIGWITAFKTIYPFECAAYSTPVGEVSMPVKTRYGYHIVKTEKKRKTLGSAYIAHILVLANEKNEEERKNGWEKINKCYAELEKGESFTQLALNYSDDRNSASKGGVLSWFRSGQLPENIEKVVFSLSDSGDYSAPVETEYGYHIFQLLGRKEMESFDELKDDLEQKVRRDTRNDINRQAIINRIKKEENFIKYPENIIFLEELLDSSLYKGLWQPEIAEGMIEPVFSLKDKNYSISDFAQYIAEKKSYPTNLAYIEILNGRLEEFIGEKVIEYEKERLEEKYEDFRYLMDEYHDGILLFNITDELVWSKAVKDTVGLEKFYEKNKNDYMWNDRIEVIDIIYTDEQYKNPILKNYKKFIKKNLSDQDMRSIICGNDSVDCCTISIDRYEKDENELVKGIPFKKGEIKEYKIDEIKHILIVKDIIPSQPKLLSEIRGLIVAAYQTELEKQWIEKLKKKYTVSINENVLDKIEPEK